MPSLLLQNLKQKKLLLQPKKRTAKAEDKPKAEKATPAKKASAKVTAVDYTKMTVAELKAAAKGKGIAGYTSLKKAELIDALSK